MARPESANYGAGIWQCDHKFGPRGDFASIACVRVYRHHGPHCDWWTFQRIPLVFRRKRSKRMAGK